jgi:hypothetical protein
MKWRSTTAPTRRRRRRIAAKATNSTTIVIHVVHLYKSMNKKGPGYIYRKIRYYGLFILDRDREPPLFN